MGGGVLIICDRLNFWLWIRIFFGHEALASFAYFTSWY